MCCPSREELVRPEDVVLHEDDWRQVELVAAVNKSAIADNLAAIRRIQAERVGSGFAQIHVRETPRQPLIGLQIGRRELNDVLSADFRRAAGVTFSAESRRIHGAFAHVGPTSTVYGVERDGFLTALGLDVTSRSDRPDSGALALGRLADQHAAFVVDWVSARCYPDLAED